MATQTLAQVRAAVKAAHPPATTAAINATARKDYSTQQKAVATPTTASAPIAVVGSSASTAIQSAQGQLGGQAPWVTGAWTAAGAGITAWGSTPTSGGPSGDEYVQAQQYYTALTNPAARVGFFNQPVANLQNQLNQALVGIIGGGQAYYPVAAYGAIPTTVLKTAGVTDAQLSFYQSQLVAGGATIVQRPEQSTASLTGLAKSTGQPITTIPASTLASGAASSLIPNPMVSSTITPSGTGTIYSAAVGGTGTAGGVTPSGATAGGEGTGTTVSGGGSDAGNSSGLPDLASATVAGFPLVDVLLIAGAGVGLWYVSKHRKKGGKK